MRYLLLLLLAGSGCSKSRDKDAELASLRARLVEAETQLAQAQEQLAAREAQLARMEALAAAQPAPAADGGATRPAVEIDPRTRNLRALCSYFETNIPHLSSDLREPLSSTLDDFGRVKDPIRLCVVMRDRFAEKYGPDGVQAALVGALGAEVGTQVANGSLCDGPAVSRGLPPPTAAAVSQAFARRIEGDAVAWTRVLEVSLDELIDEKGHLRDISSTARRAHEILDRKPHSWSRAIELFGNEVGTAVHFDRVSR